MAAIALPTQTNTQTSENMLADSGRRIYVGSLGLPSSYNSGGYTFSSWQFGMFDYETLISGVFISGGHALTLRSVVSNGRLTGFLVFDLTTGAEAVSTFDCSGQPCLIVLIGN